MHRFNLSPVTLPPGSQALRQEVRTFLTEELGAITPVERAKSWFGCDPAFSRKLGAQGWIGMTWPKEYGGHERPASDRYIVIEELLTAGAPVGAHWIADRQSGPLILNYGSPAAKAAFLPGIAAGEVYFCIGMSEPNAGSDLAAIRTTAERVDGGWTVNGAKLWTTNIAEAHQMIALVRTEKASETRHGGMSQLIIDLNAEGVTRNTIMDHQSERHFGEVHFDNVFVADDMVVGQPGAGWAQVNAELALERSGPERYLSSYRLYEELVLSHRGRHDPAIEQLVGELTARLWTLRQMSVSVSHSIGTGDNPTIEAAIVKDLGATLEQDLPALVQATIDDSSDAPERKDLLEVMEYLLLFSPIFSLRGGTREILRGIIAREIGLR
ncbi:acyl-CoA dehydrogenase [Croceicoccus estronivorus]|uniref:acyl-CoA dehydrogenase family protein n=1 Tax=Croceicoccus estronivorus TaxID=1172626 RepID=UPI00083534EF|nr:acyl-CoA dehydrogenase family protein [Croceicoccus estronivorus]OCC25627.1 acyl-CoA dehydrogenase [Croceicoccus estronivorus]